MFFTSSHGFNGTDRRPSRLIVLPLPIVFFFMVLLYLPCVSMFPRARWVHHITSPFVCTSMKVNGCFHGRKVCCYESKIRFHRRCFASVEEVNFTPMNVEHVHGREVHDLASTLLQYTWYGIYTRWPRVFFTFSQGYNGTDQRPARNFVLPLPIVLLLVVVYIPCASNVSRPRWVHHII